MAITTSPIFAGPESTKLLTLNHLNGVVPKGRYSGFDITPYTANNVMLSSGRLLSQEMVKIESDTNIMFSIPIGATKQFKIVLYHDFESAISPIFSIKEVGVDTILPFDNVMGSIFVDASHTLASEFTIVQDPIVDLASAVFGAVEQSQLSDLWGRFGEAGDYILTRDSEGLVTSVEQQLTPSLSKIFTIARDPVSKNAVSITILNQDLSYQRTYTLNRDPAGVVQSVTVS